MLIREAVTEFISWNERNRKHATTKSYRSKLKPFTAQFGARAFESLTPLDVEKWIHDQSHWPDGRPKANDTIRGYIIAVETFQSWMLRYKYITEKVFDAFEKPPGTRREKIPTPEMYDQIEAKASPEFRRILRAFRLCGARSAELAAARIEDIKESVDAPGVRLIVLKDHKTSKKTNKPRKIPINSEMREIITEAIGGRAEGPIFLAPTGVQWTAQNLSQSFRKIRDSLGLPKWVILYLTRHECGTIVTHEKGIHAARELLGHASTSTTERYIKQSDQYLSDVAESRTLKKGA